MIKIAYNYNTYQDLEKSFTFNGGEEHIVLPETFDTVKCVDIEAKIHNSKDIMQLLLVKNAIDIKYKNTIKKYLSMPYIPYARQDRVCNRGEALSIKVFADLINSMNFDEVGVLDPHSDVAPGLINNCEIVAVETILDKLSTVDWDIHDKLTHGNITLVCPDAGAEKKILKVAQHYGGLGIIRASKVRDTKTGNIIATKIGASWGYGSMEGMDLLIVDDICDGGMTFIKLAEQLKYYNPKSINLYVTHGIFSKGYQPLFDAGINKIYTTDSFPQEKVKGLEVINL